MTLKYSEFISKYQSLSGKENVTVPLFKEPVNYPDSFLEKIVDYLEVDNIKKNTKKAAPKKTLSPQTANCYITNFAVVSPILSEYIPSIVLVWWRGYLNKGSSMRGLDELPVEMLECLMLCIE